MSQTDHTAHFVIKLIEYNLSEFAIRINISSLESTKVENTYKIYKFLEQRLDYNLLQMKCKIH
jgi:hypothetical protein